MLRKKKKVETNDIRFNYLHGHLAHVKKVSGEYPNQKVTSVFITSKEFDGNVKNIKMIKPIKIGNKEHGYFIKRVRSYPINSYSLKIYNKKLSKKDRRTSKNLYKRYLKNKKRD